MHYFVTLHVLLLHFMFVPTFWLPEVRLADSLQKHVVVLCCSSIGLCQVCLFSCSGIQWFKVFMNYDLILHAMIMIVFVCVCVQN